MLQSKRTFLERVISQIVSKEAKKFVEEELDYHLAQTKADWLKKGLSEEQAEEKAVKQMGNPEKLGVQLNLLHKPRVDWVMVCLLIAALLLSFLPVIAMPGDGVNVNKMIFVLLGLLAVLLLVMIDYRHLQKLSWLFYAMGFLLLFLLLYAPFATTINGIPFLPVGSTQIGSIAALPLFYLAFSSLFINEKINKWLCFIIALFPMYYLLLLPSITTAFLYIVMTGVMFIWSSSNKKRAVITAGIGTLAFAAVAAATFGSLHEYQRARILSFIHPETDPQGRGYIYLKLKEGVSSSNWMGTSGSTSIPESHTDFVLISIAQTYGLLLVMLLLVILSLFAVRMVQVLHLVKEPFGRMLIAGGMTIYLTQLLYNAAMVFGFLPITGISLPFISYGLMPILLHSVIVGVILSVYRRKDLIRV
ncbi:FtsW/RodA/SpoVE family cell cycle protein [Bacillus lacus]|uniref:FtsW/RodA/SpoVE family cell cycle protein n=1 Tax=Metabacillus lacus TaxID=1983721 RepID=A0A7X2M049_9BACI|nr:FtsW/RodA/SpoVE family cell cycle protein [Metabacillus lacus]MRX74196.1 FtsW/RodA/SpoVE family cell cycle protein [Metabacillus lacus]